MPTLATIRVLSDEVIPSPIEGVLIELYDLTPSFVTSGTTNTIGEVVFDVPDATYNLYFYKQGVSVLPSQPQQIVVDSLQPTNIFEVSAHVRTLPESTNPNLCRITGYIRGIDNTPTKDTELIIETDTELNILSGVLLPPRHRVFLRPDKNGYFDFELYRNIKYIAYFKAIWYFLNTEPAALLIHPPDLPGLELHTLLFPVQINLGFSAPTLNILLTDEPNEDIETDLTWSDGSSRTSVPWSHLQLSYTVDDIVGAELSGNKIRITPLALGSTEVSVQRVFRPSVKYDAPLFTSDTLVVTVS